MRKTIPGRHNMAALNSPEGTLADFFNSHFFESSQFTLPTFHWHNNKEGIEEASRTRLWNMAVGYTRRKSFTFDTHDNYAWFRDRLVWWYCCRSWWTGRVSEYINRRTETLFKPEEFENANFAFSCERKRFIKRFENDDVTIIIRILRFVAFLNFPGESVEGKHWMRS